VEILIRHALIIANPASRRGRMLRHAAEDAFRKAGVHCETRATERRGHAAEIAARAEESFDAIFPLGGDGTAMEVIGALAGSNRPVGILPGGTGNLIAGSLRIPVTMEGAVNALLAGTPARIDLGIIDGKHRFAFAAGVGIDVRMVEETPAALKRRLGVLAYALAATRAVFRRERFTVRVTVDGEVTEREASSVFIANFGAVLNDLFWLGPGIRQDDGRLDLCIFTARTIPDAVRIVWRLLRRDFREDQRTFYRSGTHFRVETTPSLRYQADGELLDMTPFEVRAEPLATLLLIPKS
jgi:YegS/Rv2252/BmrU family lipid kinase